MSMFAVSAASRHLRDRMLSSANSAVAPHFRMGAKSSLASAAVARRYLSSNVGGGGGSGLRRPRTSGRRQSGQIPPLTRASSAPRAGGGGSSAPPPSPTRGRVVDPHSIANEMVTNAAAEGRAPGTESLASLTREQRMSNYAMATGLLAFVSYVFYYSLASVGGDSNARALLFGTDDARPGDGGDGDASAAASSNPGFEEFLREANEGRSEEERRLEAEASAGGEARELAELEGAAEYAIEGAASAEEEREMERAAGFGEEGAGRAQRPLWKRVIFFWRRE